MDFDDNTVASVAAQLGATPEYVHQQLLSEGNNYVGGAGPAANLQPAPGGMDLGAMQPGALPPEPSAQPFNLGQMQPAALPPEPAAPTPARWAVNQDNLVMPPPLARAPASSPGAATRTGGIRATGAGMQSQAPGAAGGMAGQGMGRVRQLFDQRDKELAGAYQGAAQQVQEGQQRLANVEQEAYGFQQDKLDLDAAHAGSRAGLYDDLQTQQQNADQAEAVAQQKEAGVLQAAAEKSDKLRSDYTNARVRDMPTSTRVASAFGLAFSGIADSLNQAVGNRTDFLQSTFAIVNQNIDRDVQEQLEQIERQGGAADEAERSLVRLRQGTRDDRAFRSQARSAIYEQFAHRLDQQAANATSETARVTAAAGATEFKLQAEKERQAGAQANLSDAQKRLRDLGDTRFMAELGFAMPKQGPKAAKPTPQATGLLQVNPDATGEDRSKAQAIHSGAAGIMSNIDSLIEMAKRGMTLSPDQRQIARRRVGALKSQFNGVFGDGTAPNEAQLEALDDMFSNPVEANLGNAQQQFEVFKQDAINQTNAKMQPYGYAIGGGVDFEPE